MRARSSEPAPSRSRCGRRAATAAPARGFTLAELIAVMIIIGVLAAVAMPKMGAGLSLRDEGWHDQLVGALRYAHQLATSHRRLVCATIASSTLSLSIAPTNPATACTTSVPGPDGSANYASDSAGLGVSPTGTLYFQPSGRVSSDGAGSTIANWTITAGGASDTIQVIGETGHVE
jgi:prepilin-type N-terminal cleavage/methylation domain-containing protein